MTDKQSEEQTEELVAVRMCRRACKFMVPSDIEGEPPESYRFGDKLEVTREMLEDHPSSLMLEEEFCARYPEEVKPEPEPEPEPEADQADSEDFPLLGYEEE